MARPMTELASAFGPSAPIPEFIPICLRIGPFTSTMLALEVVESIYGTWLASARITGRYSGLAPAMTAMMATFSTVNGRIVSKGTGVFFNQFIRLVAGAFQHRGHSLCCREYDWIIVGPVLVLKQALQVIFRIRGQKSGFGRRLGRDPGLLFLSSQRFCQTVDDRLHYGLAADLILAFEIGFQHFFLKACKRIRHPDETEGHAGVVFEMGTNPEGHNVFIRKRHGGNTILFFQSSGKAAHGREAAPSAGNADDYPIPPVGGYLLP